MPRYLEDIRGAILARRPIIYVCCAEEDRVVAGLEALAAELLPENPLRSWSCLNGLEGAGRETLDPAGVLRVVREQSQGGMFLLKDLGVYLQDPAVQRGVREAYYALRDRDPRTVVVILAPERSVPSSLSHEVFVVEAGPPDEEELLETVRAVPLEGCPLLESELVLALKGVSLSDARHTLELLAASGELDREQVLTLLFAEKQAVVSRTGVLEFVPPRHDIGHLGGLDNLKEWFRKRKGMLSRDALDKGLPVPKGILLMGVSGCGKSFAVKTASNLWGVPLFRLDMNLVFSGLHGPPEAAFHGALHSLEGVAPVLLWIDEIENGLSMAADGSSQSHLFSAFLTWLQEKPPLVFVAATANRIEILPAEILRKGRFDQVFFCDLPNEEERRQILEIHLRLQGCDPAEFRLEFLVQDTQAWTGAEIEQAIAEARINAVSEGRDLTTDDVSRVADLMVPLSRTMHEQIRALREWSRGRATPASRPAETGGEQ